MEFVPGDRVQTPFGKGVVREVQNRGRLLVEVHGRRLVVDAADVRPLAADTRKSGARSVRLPPERLDRSVRFRPDHTVREVDLHGLTVAEALARAEAALNDALLADALELRLIHGRSGGRIRAALHHRLREIPTVRGFRIDPSNDGVTVVDL